MDFSGAYGATDCLSWSAFPSVAKLQINLLHFFVLFDQGYLICAITPHKTLAQ